MAGRRAESAFVGPQARFPSSQRKKGMNTKGGRFHEAVCWAVRTTTRTRTRVSLTRTRITLRRTRTRTTARVSAKSERICFTGLQRACIVPEPIVATAYILGKDDGSRRGIGASATAIIPFQCLKNWKVLENYWKVLESRNISGRGRSWVSRLRRQAENAMAAKTKNFIHTCQRDSEI